MKKIIYITLTTIGFLSAQNELFIPDTMSGNEFNLILQNGTTQLFDGEATATMGANGGNMAPTLIFQQGEYVNINVTNNIGEETTIHWHGMHISPENDGGPHSVIMPGDTWNPNFTVMDKACTMWYHPHLHQKTNEHVTKGITGFIIIRNDEESALNLPRTYGVDDFPLNLQTKQFDSSNQIVIGGHVDNIPMVNSTIDAYVELPAQVVRLRVLNGSSMRVFNLGLSNNATFYQIGSDGGLLSDPVSMTRLLLAPAERAELLVDLTGMEGQSIELNSYGSTLPGSAYGIAGLASMQGVSPPGYNSNVLNGNDFILLDINVGVQTNSPVLTIPNTLVNVTPIDEADATVTRSLTIQAPDMMNDGITGPFEFNGQAFNMSVINQTVQLDDTEIWEVFNMSQVGHPFHIHDVQFYILDRDGVIPSENERGRKDVVWIPMMQTVRFIAKFEDHADNEVPYMYHCHMLQHEDEGLMGQFIVEGETGCGTDEVDLWDECYSIDNTVMLNLSNSGLTGGIPPVIGDLSNLSVLFLNNNELTGEIPEEIGNISNLSYFTLSNNNITGTIPSVIGNLSALSSLDLSFNELTGEIPEEIATLPSLTSLYLNDNQLTGQIPDVICDYSWDSTSFDVSNNMLCSPYPTCIEALVGYQDESNCQVSIVDPELLNKFTLLNAFPNPFNPTVTIKYSIESYFISSLKIYDISGRLVETLHEEAMDPGIYKIKWIATNQPSGVYFAVLQSGNNVRTQKVILLK
jgi:bilirubin oxidase